jgi:membrane protease YdiL (CAAX protease family)
MTNDLSSIPLISEPLSAPLEQPQKPAAPVWRWWVFLLIIGSSPLVAAFSSASRAPNEPMQLPKTIPLLLLFCALQMVAFGVFWAIAWIFARPNRDDLLLRWRDGWKTVGWGALYSVGMRLGLLVVVIALATVVLTVLAMLGYKPEAMVEAYKNSQPDMSKIFGPVFSQGDPLYRFLLITLVSFVVAGLREELWRTATMLGLQRIAPSHWSQTSRNVLALGASSLLFGMGHWYQGVMGIVLTSFLGVVLGAIMLYHRSIWPAVIAHGCFDAASFLMLSLMGKNS